MFSNRSVSKHLFIGSSADFENKVSRKPFKINNQLISRTDIYSCLGVKMDEKLSWEEHINHICLRFSAGIGAMRRNSMGASLWNNLSLEAIISQLLSSFKATLKQRIG